MITKGVAVIILAVETLVTFICTHHIWFREFFSPLSGLCDGFRCHLVSMAWLSTMNMVCPVGCDSLGRFQVQLWVDCQSVEDGCSVRLTTHLQSKQAGMRHHNTSLFTSLSSINPTRDSMCPFRPKLDDYWRPTTTMTTTTITTTTTTTSQSSTTTTTSRIATPSSQIDSHFGVFCSHFGSRERSSNMPSEVLRPARTTSLSLCIFLARSFFHSLTHSPTRISSERRHPTHFEPLSYTHIHTHSLTHSLAHIHRWSVECLSCRPLFVACLSDAHWPGRNPSRTNQTSETHKHSRRDHDHHRHREPGLGYGPSGVHPKVVDPSILHWWEFIRSFVRSRSLAKEQTVQHHANRHTHVHIHVHTESHTWRCWRRRQNRARMY